MPSHEPNKPRLPSPESEPWQNQLGPMRVVGHYEGIDLRKPISGRALAEFKRALKAMRLGLAKTLCARLTYIKKVSSSNLCELQNKFLEDELEAFYSSKFEGAEKHPYPPAPWRTHYSEELDLPISLSLEHLRGLDAVIKYVSKFRSSVAWHDLSQFFSRQDGMSVFRRPIEADSSEGGVVAEPLQKETVKSSDFSEFISGFGLKPGAELFSVPVLLETVDPVMRLFEECAVLQSGSARERQTILRELWIDAALYLDDDQVHIRLSMAAEAVLRELEFRANYPGRRSMRQPFLARKLAGLWDQFQVAVALDQELIKSEKACYVRWPQGYQVVSLQETFYAKLNKAGKANFNSLCLAELAKQAKVLSFELSHNTREILALDD